MKTISKASMDDLKHMLDAASVGTIAATFLGMLPHIATMLSIIWAMIRIYETATVQGWLRRAVKEAKHDKEIQEHKNDQQ